MSYQGENFEAMLPFIKWYSGMEEVKIRKAYERYLTNPNELKKQWIRYRFKTKSIDDYRPLVFN